MALLKVQSRSLLPIVPHAPKPLLQTLTLFSFRHCDEVRSNDAPQGSITLAALLPIVPHAPKTLLQTLNLFSFRPLSCCFSIVCCFCCVVSVCLSVWLLVCCFFSTSFLFLLCLLVIYLFLRCCLCVVSFAVLVACPWPSLWLFGV